MARHQWPPFPVPPSTAPLRRRLARFLWVALLALETSAVLCIAVGMHAMTQPHFSVTGSQHSDLVFFEYFGGEILIGLAVITLVSIPVYLRLTGAAFLFLLFWAILFSAFVPA